MLFDAPAPLPIAEAAPVAVEAPRAPGESAPAEPLHDIESLGLEAGSEVSARPADAEPMASEGDWIGFDPIPEVGETSSGGEAEPQAPTSPLAPSVDVDGEVVAPPGWPFTPLGSPRAPSVQAPEVAGVIADANVAEQDLGLGDVLFDDPSLAPAAAAAEASATQASGETVPTEDDDALDALDALVAAGLSLDDLGLDVDSSAPSAVPPRAELGTRGTRRRRGRVEVDPRPTTERAGGSHPGRG